MDYAINTLFFTIAHSCVVHPCFFVPPCPLPRCPPLLLRATLSTLAMSTAASSCRLVHSRVFNPCFLARATLSTPAISVAPFKGHITLTLNISQTATDTAIVTIEGE